MAIEYQQLLNYPIPEVRQRILPRAAALYALSIGFGQDPMDEAQLAFVDYSSSLKVVPSMATVLAHPGFWLGDPATGVDAVQLVHGEQSITLHSPLPAEGEVVGQTRVIDIIDKGPGRGALLYSEKRLVDARSGELLATTNSTTFLRGDGGFGGPSGPVRAPHPLPESPPDFAVELVTRPEQALFYRLNGDSNPLHSDPAVAAKAGFPRPILHGLCTLGIVTHALIRTLASYRVERFREVALRFAGPVYPGETIRVDIWSSGAFRALSVDRGVVVINNGRAVLE